MSGFPRTSGGSGGGSVDTVEGGNPSVVVTDPAGPNVSLVTGTFDVLAGLEPAAGPVTFNGQRAASLAPGVASTDAATVGQLPTTFPGLGGSIFISGRWYPQVLVTGTALLITQNELYLSPMVVGVSHTFPAIGVNATVAGTGGTLTLVVYADNGSGYPGPLVYSGTVSAAATGVIDITGILLTLTPGLYWIGLVGQGGTVQPTLATAQNNSYTAPLLGNSAVGNGQNTNNYVLAGISGAPPNPLTAGATISASVVPVVQLEA
jgi:hypothetical protein